MNELETFPVEQFYQALMSSSGLEPKLDLILKQISAKNTQMTYQAIVHIHQILNSKLQPPLMKFNALNCAKIFFDTCEYSVILFIEVYLLPIIFEIAAFKATNKSEEGLSLYFIERGAQPTKQVKRLGFNHVSLAIEFIYATASVKIYRVLENEELEEQSHFKKIAKALKMRGVPQIASFKFYNGSYIEKTRRIFIDKLQVFNPQGFIDFVTDLIFGQLTQGKHLDLDSKRLIMHGDIYIISPLVNRIEEQLNEIDGNFQGKRKILTLFYEFVKYGYAQAILLLNSSEFLNSIAIQISKVHGDKDMDEGRRIYQQINDSQKEKKLFYLEFLKGIEAWAHAVPLNEHNQQSEAKRLYEFLKFQKNFKFPENQNLHKYKSEMDIYLRQNIERNKKVIELITKREESQARSDAKSRYKITSLKDESNIKSKQKKPTMEFEQLQEMVINGMMVLQVVGFQEKRLDKEMKKLLKFKESWHKNIQLVKKKVNDDDEPYNLDMLISEGQIVYEQIIGIEKIYDEYKSNKINFEKTQQKISAFLNQLEEQNHASQVSVSAKSKNTRLTNRRDLKSKISQKARDRSFSNHSKHSKNLYVSQSKSAKSNVKNTKKYPNRQPIIKKNQPQKQIPKIYNQINETFAINEPQNNLSYSAKKVKENFGQQRLNYQRKIQDQKVYKQNTKKSLDIINEYGVQQQIVKNNQLSTATFIPVKNSNISLKIEPKNQIFNTPATRPTVMQKLATNPKQKIIEKFEDSFEVKSPFKKKTHNEKKSGSKIAKKQSFSRVLFTSQDQNTSNVVISANQKILSRVIEAQEQNKPQNKKKSLIKKILSSDKISFQKNHSSESQEQQPAVKAQNNPSNNKMLSKYVSFNNGNISAYFNQQSVDEYGLMGNLKDSLKHQSRQKQGLNGVIQSSERGEVKNVNKNKILVFDEDDKKYKNSQKANDKHSSKSISEIKGSQIRQIEGNFDDLQLANSKQQINQQSVIKRNRSLLKSRLRDSRLRDSRLRDSRMKNNLNDSQVSEVCRLDISQKIKDQDSFQMLQSHYKTRQVEQEKLKKSSSNNQIKFGEIVQVKKEIIHDRNRVLSPFNHEQTDNTKNRMKKLIEMPNINMNLKNSNKSNGLMQVLSERTAKKGIKDYLIQKEKNKLIKNLNLRIKKLQNQQITIQTQLSKKNQELRSISYKNYSEKQHMKFRNQNVSLGSIQNSMRQNDSSNTSLYYRLNPPINDPNKINVLLSGDTRPGAQNHVDLNAYEKYFDQFSDNSLKKNCLRNKSLIVTSDEMEIGCMSINKDKFINFTLFITPKLLSFKNVKFTTQPNQNLTINFFPDSFYNINAKKQQTLNIKICVQNVPFSIPKINIEYELDSTIQSKQHQNLHKSSIQLILPCTFNKLCSFQSISINDFYNMFNSGDFKNDIKSCQKFKLNSKVFKQQKIKQFFPYMTLLKKIDQANGKSRIVYGFEANYNGNMFLVLLKIQDKKYAKVQAKNMTGQSKADKYVEFFIATFKKLIGL